MLDYKSRVLPRPAYRWLRVLSPWAANRAGTQIREEKRHYRRPCSPSRMDRSGAVSESPFWSIFLVQVYWIRQRPRLSDLIRLGCSSLFGLNYTIRRKFQTTQYAIVALRVPGRTRAFCSFIFQSFFDLLLICLKKLRAKYVHPWPSRCPQREIICSWAELALCSYQKICVLCSSKSNSIRLMTTGNVHPFRFYSQGIMTSQLTIHTRLEIELKAHTDVLSINPRP